MISSSTSLSSPDPDPSAGPDPDPLPLPPPRWSILLIVLTSQSLGLLIGANVVNPLSGQTIATVILLSTMLVGEWSVSQP